MSLPKVALLDELQTDALTELFNIGVSRAAASLRLMIGAEVLLSVPSVTVMSGEEAAQLLVDRGGDKLVAVHQKFDGDISGRALLIFPEANSLELVRAVAGKELSLEDIIELEQESLAETGNIILNACLATIANMLQRSMKISLPEILHGSGPDFFKLSGAAISDEIVLFLYINFLVKHREIRGYVAMLIDLPALASLKVLIAELIRRESVQDS